MVLLGAAMLAAAVFVIRNGRVAATRSPIVAVGHVAGYELGGQAEDLTAPLSDLLATNLARVPGLRVVSAGRMMELIARAGTDTSGRGLIGAVTVAARVAGATDLVDGTLYGRPDGRLRLDLRRVDVATGAILDVRTVEGGDLFALVDSGTAGLATRLGADAPTGSVADATTRSLAAYRLYVEGLKRHYALDDVGAYRLFGEAVAEDSTFAMATYYWALKTPNTALSAERMERAMRLSKAASDRERLTIRAGWALHFSAPELAAIADTLATRYPDEVEGYLYRGASLVMDQDYLAAVPYLRRAVQMDSLGTHGRTTGARGACPACDARWNLFFAYTSVDSLDAAEREAKAWIRTVPTSAVAWMQWCLLRDVQGRPAEALAALDSARRLENGGTTDVQNMLALHWLYVGDYARAEELERVRLASASIVDQHQALWYLAIALRAQGRLIEALATARRYRAAEAENEATPLAGGVHQSALMEAIMLDGAGRYGAAAALFDSLARWRVPGLALSQYARNRVWMTAQAATAHAAAGDTSPLPALVDTITTYGTRSAYGRDHRLHHHVRGLLLAARGDDAAAVAEYRASIRSLTRGYTRTNAALAHSLLRHGQAAEAVAVLQAALRGDVEGPGLYASRTELHELLARAWEAAGGSDSAVFHYSAVARAWQTGDAPFRSRAASAAASAARLNVRR